jgi:hypothetical protein
MKFLRLSFLALVLLGGAFATSPARAEVEVSFDYFYDSLSPYGEWADVGDYGPCWSPTNVDAEWSPYADGYWAYTDAGWTWVSYEDYGGIVYHYGRWLQVAGGRWFWRPDYEWAPAWVSWRHSPEYIGWAPLPPEARWRPETGISVWVDSEYDLGPGYYHFCHPRDFGAPVLREVIIDRQENVTIIRGTVNITNITYNTGFAGGAVIFNGGPSFVDINRVVTRPIPALKLVRNAGFDAEHWRDHRGRDGRIGFNAVTAGNQLIVAAPVVRPPHDPGAFHQHVKSTIAADKVTHGWGAGKNPAAEQDLRQEIHRQSKGFTPDNKPAHAFVATDLKGVPAKGDAKAPTPGVTATGPSGDGRDKGTHGRRPENVIIPPTAPPSGPGAVGNPNIKPFNPAVEPGPKGKIQGGPGGPGNGLNTPADNAGRQQAEKIRAEELRREEAFRQQQQQIKIQPTVKPQPPTKQQPQQFQEQPQKGVDVRRLQETERDRDKQKFEGRGGPLPPQQVQPQHQPGQGNQPPGSPRSNGGKSKDGKDKDKDKNQ